MGRGNDDFGSATTTHADDPFTRAGDWDLGNVSNYGNPNTPADREIADKKATDSSTGTKNPHYDDRHGANTSLQAQYDRAMHGTNPQTGKSGNPVNASKFFNSTDMAYALNEAERLYAQNPNMYKSTGNKVNIDFNRPVGEGFMGATDENKNLGIEGEYRWSNIATVGIDSKTGKAYTAYPNMDNGYKQDNDMLKFIK